MISVQWLDYRRKRRRKNVNRKNVTAKIITRTSVDIEAAINSFIKNNDQDTQAYNTYIETERTEIENIQPNILIRKRVVVFCGGPHIFVLFLNFQLE